MRALVARLSLRACLIILVVLALLPMVAWAIYWAVHESRAAVGQARSSLQLSAVAAAQGQDAVAASAGHLLAGIAVVQELQAGPIAGCARYLAQLRQRFPAYANIGVVDMDGTIRCQSQPTAARAYAGDRPYFREALGRQGFVVSEYVIGRVSGKPVLTFARPLKDAGGAATGVVFATVFVETLERAVAAVPLLPGASFLIMNRHGLVLAAQPGAGVAAGGTVDSLVIRQAALDRQPAVAEGIDAEGHMRIYATSPGHATASSGIFIIVGIDRDLVLAPYRKTLWLQLLLVAATCLLSAYLASLLGFRSIVQPARQILDATRRAAGGELGVRIPLGTAQVHAELSKIAAAFNLMARALEKREGEHLDDLERSRRAYAAQQVVLNSMQEGLFARDLAGNDLIVNAAAQWAMESMLDRPAAPQAGDPPGYGIFLPGTDTPYPAEQLPMYRALRGESGSNVDMLVRNGHAPQGRLIRCRYRPMRDGQATVGGMVTFLDITRHKREQDELLLLRNAVAMLNDIVMITEAEPIDEPGPRIVFVNEAFERLTGYTQAEVLGRTPRILQGPGTGRAALDRIRGAMARWQPVRQEVLNYTKAGRPFWNEIDMVPLADATGWYTHWISVERDITGRKLAQQALEDSERRYQVLFDQSPLPMWVFDVQSLCFLEVNESAIRRYGFSRGEFLSMTLKDIRSESEWARMEQEVEDGFPGGPGPWWHMCKDGSEFPAQIASQGIAYDGHEARFTVVEDITVRHRAQQVVLEQQFALQRTADAAAVIVQHRTVHDMLAEVAQQARGVIRAHQSVVSLTIDSSWAQAISAVSLSDKYASFQRLEGEPDGTGIYAVVCETNQPMRLTQAELVAHPRWRGFGAGAARHPPMRGWLAVPLIGRDGSNIGVLQLTDKYEGEFTQHDEYIAMEMAQLASVALQNVRLFETINRFNADLEKKVAERTAELTRQEAMFRALAEQAPQVVWTYEHGQGVTFFNRAWYELMGGSPPDWHGRKWIHAIHPDDLEAVTHNWKRAERDRAAFSGVRRLRSSDGRIHTMSYRAVPVFDEQGRLSFWVGIDADITELKAFEQALRRSNEELEAFSYSVAHDLRAPLNSIDGFSQLLARDLGEAASSASLHYIARIQAGVAQMAQLIEDLLQLAQLSRTQMRREPVDLGAMALEILDRLRSREPRRQAVVTVQEDLQVQGDSRLVRVLMENLLANAWKFSSQLAGPAEITVGGLPPAHGERVMFVRDNGAGFDMAYANKLFQVFQRLHGAAEFPGTGVGLAIARRVTQRHGGRIWAESAPGRGATFYFVLPDTPPAALPLGEPPHG